MIVLICASAALAVLVFPSSSNVNLICIHADFVFTAYNLPQKTSAEINRTCQQWPSHPSVKKDSPTITNGARPTTVLSLTLARETGAKARSLMLRNAMQDATERSERPNSEGEM